MGGLQREIRHPARQASILRYEQWNSCGAGEIQRFETPLAGVRAATAKKSAVPGSARSNRDGAAQEAELWRGFRIAPHVIESGKP